MGIWEGEGEAKAKAKHGREGGNGKGKGNGNGNDCWPFLMERILGLGSVGKEWVKKNCKPNNSIVYIVIIIKDNIIWYIIDKIIGIL